MKVKKIPLRKCIGCNEQKPKKELIRIVKNKENIINIDLTGKLNGRGAYLCKDVECLKKAQESNRLSRSLQTKLEDDIYNELKIVIEGEN